MLAQNGRHVLFPEKAIMEWRGSELMPISVESWLCDSGNMIVTLQRVVEYTGQFSIISGQICASFNHFSVCMQIKNYRSQGSDSTGRVLARQVQETKLGLLHPCKKLGMVCTLQNPRTRERETGGFLGFTCQPTELASCKPE